MGVLSGLHRFPGQRVGLGSTVLPGADRGQVGIARVDGRGSGAVVVRPASAVLVGELSPSPTCCRMSERDSEDVFGVA